VKKKEGSLKDCLGLGGIFNPKSSLQVTWWEWSSAISLSSRLSSFQKKQKVFSNRRRLQHTSAPNDSLGKYRKFSSGSRQTVWSTILDFEISEVNNVIMNRIISHRLWRYVTSCLWCLSVQWNIGR